jgi:hypothetical protein
MNKESINLHDAMAAADMALDQCLENMGLPSQQSQINHLYNYQFKILFSIFALAFGLSLTFTSILSAFTFSTTIAFALDNINRYLEFKKNKSIFNKLPFYQSIKNSHDYRKTIITNALNHKDTQFAILHYLELIEKTYKFNTSDGFLRQFYINSFVSSVKKLQLALTQKDFNNAYKIFMSGSIYFTIQSFRDSPEYKSIFMEPQFQAYKDKVFHEYKIYKQLPMSEIEVEKNSSEKIKDML